MYVVGEMVKLEAETLRYMTREEFRVLTAIEMGQKNHDVVPTPLIARIAGLKRGGAAKAITLLHKNKLIYHDAKKYDGYRLTYTGYDYLALRTFVSRGLITGLGRKIGVGKESDIYECINANGQRMVLKIHRYVSTSVCPSLISSRSALLRLLVSSNTRSPPPSITLPSIIGWSRSVGRTRFYPGG